MNAPTALVEEREHALLAPSAAHTWILCPASIAASIDQPDESSEYADEGTAAHTLMAWCLQGKSDAIDYVGHIIEVGERKFVVDHEMADFVQLYVDRVRERVEALQLAGASVEMLIEQRLSIEHITGEPGAKGTSDTVLIATWPDGRAEQEVWDLKFGRGVEVLAEWNPQGLVYAGAAYEEHSTFVDFQRVRIVIHQPRVNPDPNEWELVPSQLVQWIDTVARPAAEHARGLIGQKLAAADFNPGEKQCRFCKAKAVCPALARHVEHMLGADFESLDLTPEQRGPLSLDLLDNAALGVIYPVLPLIEQWGKAVLARIEIELHAGREVPGTKLVQGRRGARQWESSDDAEKLLKGMRLKNDQMYNFKLISPTQAEKLLKAESPRRWKKVEALITQRDGAPSVASESDKRPALVISPPEDDFEAVTDDDGGDLT
ncbi:DUF2800 domain-containing protein [Paraburkholderia sp. Ac-20347]|uniref:DUF2800 domain-containing protein n=1 Tax=Paraburkholderia sp. Ac-20347 TaxID=2703892 RepID=UPI00197CEF4E|nr:DUF2800 domain-containing protein [Paraburkholderia sp. Ac-20347]MBN3809435.1 DUF2800 domain-containing protein [Paraburkholderia sp. Ac-20347]